MNDLSGSTKTILLISKLNTYEPITKAEVAELERLMFDGAEIGSKEDFEKNYGEQPPGQFIRCIVVLDVNAVKQAFLTSRQWSTQS